MSALVLAAVALFQAAGGAAPWSTALDGAPLVVSGLRVWNGQSFVERELYVEDGRFVAAPPPDAERLEAKGFAVPPYADAHVHHFTARESAGASRALFLRHGFAYVANLCGPHGARTSTAEFTNRPDGVDVLFAHGAITGLTAHPVPLYRMLHRRRGLSDDTFLAMNDDDTIYRVDSEATLDSKLELLLGTGPDLVKVMVSRIRHREPGSTDSLAPDLLPVIVERAHAAGKRVVAHTDDAEDFAFVVRCGVDWLAHTPGFGRRADEPLGEFLLTPELAREAAQRGTVVITTAGAYDTARADNRPAQEAVDENLRILRDAGVTIAFGSDDWAGPETELRALRTHAGFSPRELLELLCEVTPRVLYPGRSIGSLEPGHEASLLVLANDPLVDSANLLGITLVIKEGRVLGSPDSLAK